jgi:predicted DNA-binding protein
MKIKPAPQRLTRTKPMSFRFPPELVEQLKKLSKATKKTKTEIIEELIKEAFKDTIKRK